MAPTSCDTRRGKIGALTQGRPQETTNGDNNKADTRPAASGSDDLDEVVFVLQPGDSVKKVKVRTDIQDINYIEILDGLKEGDQVITGPYSVISKTLKGGQKVKVVPKDKLFEASNKN